MGPSYLNYACTGTNQNHNKILELDWFQLTGFEHLQDSVRVMLVIGQCNRTVKGTVNMSCLCNTGPESVMCARCCLAFRRVNCCFIFVKTCN